MLSESLARLIDKRSAELSREVAQLDAYFAFLVSLRVTADTGIHSDVVTSFTYKGLPCVFCRKYKPTGPYYFVSGPVEGVTAYDLPELVQKFEAMFDA